MRKKLFWVSLMLFAVLGASGCCSDCDCVPFAIYGGSINPGSGGTTPINPDQVGITPRSARLGETPQQLVFRIPGPDGSLQDVTDRATWNSSNPAVAPVDGRGLVTPQQAGVTIVTGSFNGVELSVRIVVDKVAGRDWTTRAQLDSAFGAGTFVSVGTGGVIVSSSDGATWTVRDSGTTFDLNGTTFGSGQFVTVGEFGTILTSPDGADWTPRTGPGATNLNSVAFGNGRYVAVGDGGTLLTSTDGATWSTGSSGVVVNLNEIQFANSMFVTVGNAGTILTSTDGLSWTPQNTPVSANLNSLAFSGTLFVAVGDRPAPGQQGTILTGTADGATWTSQTSGTFSNLTGVDFGNGTFIAVGPTATRRSNNGVTWSFVSSFTSFARNDVAFLNNLFVVGTGGGGVFTSSTGTSYTTTPVGILTNGVHSVRQANGVFFALNSSGSLLTSNEGVLWQHPTSGSSAPLLDVAFGAGRTVAVGAAGTIVTSTDLTNWTTATSGTTESLSSVSFGENHFVAVGTNGILLTSPTGEVWTPDTSNTSQNLNRVRFENGQFVAVGNGGTILTQSGASAWTPRGGVSAADLMDVAFGNSVYVAVGNGGAVLTSSDGVNWTPRDPGHTLDYRSISFGNGRFAASGGALVTSAAPPSFTFNAVTQAVMTSPDGVSWTPQSDTDSGGISFAGGRFVAGGANSLVTSP